MFDSDTFTQIKAKLNSANSILILLPPTPNRDLLLAGLALHQALSADNKTITIGCSSLQNTPDLPPQSSSIKSSIGNQTLVVSFDYKEDSVEHVSYDIDEATNRFFLRIKPKSGSQPLDTNSINYSYTGASANLVITLGIKSLEELGRLYSDEKDFLDSATILNFHLKTPTKFAAINHTPKRATSYTELVTFLLRRLNLKLTPSLSSQLFQHLSQSTNNFSSNISATTFESAAHLLRSGANKPTPDRSSSQPQNPSVPPVPEDWRSPKIFRSGRLK